MSVLFVGLMVLVIGLGAFAVPRSAEPYAWYGSMVLLPLLILVVTPLFAVRGYRVVAGALLVERPLWTTRLELEQLSSARAEPEATAKSIRVFGNGGAFSFTGRFSNATLGSYRAFATDFEHTVVLRFANRGPVVVTPDDPARFVSLLSAQTRESS